mgnify:CR=1 FL=1
MSPQNPHDDYPHPSSIHVTKVMKANKRVDTKPEVAIRSGLHKLGYRFRKDFVITVSGRNCRPDIVFSKKKVAVFIDGCFWHSCPEHGRHPKSNVEYWRKKFSRNKQRDELDDRALTASGWIVVRIWEHRSVEEATEEIIRTLSARS